MHVRLIKERSMKKIITKSRIVFACAIVFLCITALYVRKISGANPNFFTDYYPDTAWTMAVYCGFGFLFNRGVRLNFPAALIFSYLIEISQLFSTPFLNAVRSNVIGGLILGYGFLWSDIVCYTVGAVICFIIEILIRKAAKRKLYNNI